MISQKRMCFYSIWTQITWYGYAMNKTVPLNSYKWANVSIFTDDFIKDYDDTGDKGYLLEVDVEYPKELLSAHKDLPSLTERRFKLHKEFEHKVSKEIEKVHKKCIKRSILTMSLRIN